MGPSFSLPEGFRFGVTTAGFQVEGGYNGPGEPANDWATWESTARVEPSGIALDFWNGYERHLDRAAAAGCNAFRLSVEWARCEPRDGEVDHDALTRYAAILEACRDRGLEPMVTLHHFTHPAWLGPDFWVGVGAAERFARWAGTAVAALRHGCRQWVTVNEMNAYAAESALTGRFPPGRRRDVRALIRTLDHLLAAHVLAYRVIREVQPEAVIATSTRTLCVYELDRLLVDVLLARSRGLGRHDVRGWLQQRRSEFHGTLGGGAADELVRRLAATLVPLDKALPLALGCVYESPLERPLDVVQIAYHHPRVSRHVRLPGRRTAGGRAWQPLALPWEETPDPPGLTAYCGIAGEPDLAVQVVENGLCNRARLGRSFPRLDGWDRPRHLREHLAAVVAALDHGVPVTGYWHRTLADDYAWGSYEPRFGLHGVDREQGVRWSELDSMGGDAAGAYRRIVDGLRAGDRSVLE